MGLFSKVTIDEYNNKLEQILENKGFDSETKNLLLSMLYKIENSYYDYNKVKVETYKKEELIEKILDIIKNECNNITIVTPQTQKSKELEKVHKKYIIDESKGTIIVYANEKNMLSALITLDSKISINKFKEKNQYDNLNKQEKYTFNAIEHYLTIGKSMHVSEIIRDFNGWSWNSDLKDIEDIEINLLYQSMNLLLGNKFYEMKPKEKDAVEIEDIEVNTEDLSILNDKKSVTVTSTEEKEKIQKNKIKEIDLQLKEELEMKNNNIEYINIVKKSFEKTFLKERTDKIVENINNLILAIEARKNKEIMKEIIESFDEKKEKIDLMNNKTEFLNEITKQKKSINKEIEKIDKMLNNKELLKKEYEVRNLKLENEYKIFSISHLATILEKERITKINELKQYNKILEPSEYIRVKEELEKECETLKIVTDNENESKKELLMETQIEIIKCFLILIDNAETKQSLIDLIYKFRYYCLLPINNKELIKDSHELKKGIKKVINTLIDKCIDKKIIENISNSISLCYTILKYLFETKIIDLEKIYIKVIKEQETTNITKDNQKIKTYNIVTSMYDSKEEEEKHKDMVDNLGLLNVKLNRKILLFI